MQWIPLCEEKNHLILFCHLIFHSLPHQDGNNAFHIIKTQALKSNNRLDNKMDKCKNEQIKMTIKIHLKDADVVNSK
jgi:hypothetical protein